MDWKYSRGISGSREVTKSIVMCVSERDSMTVLLFLLGGRDEQLYEQIFLQTGRYFSLLNTM